jgi:ElaB/YqjD/DUF883 family membrane-anchored ribosome-binding protein
MSEQNGTPRKPNIEEIRAEIKLTRAELGETVQALAAKADVKARAREQVEQTRERVKVQASEAADRWRSRLRGVTEPADGPEVRAGGVPVSLIVAGVVALTGIILIVRGRRR